MNIKKSLLSFIIIFFIFLVDRISKIYILRIAELEGIVDFFINPYLNIYLVWNKGIAFGLLSFNENITYKIITLIIFIVIAIISIMCLKASGIKRYSLIFVLGGALGNIFDRIYYSAVPDFIDLHVNNFHWFIFNVADIFITLGIICLIYAEIFLKDTEE